MESIQDFWTQPVQLWQAGVGSFISSILFSITKELLK